MTPIKGEFTPGSTFICHACRKNMVQVPAVSWANNFVCGCGQEYHRVLPMASQADLNHLFGIKPSEYPEFGSF